MSNIDRKEIINNMSYILGRCECIQTRLSKIWAVLSEVLEKEDDDWYWRSTSEVFQILPTEISEIEATAKSLKDHMRWEILDEQLGR